MRKLFQLALNAKSTIFIALPHISHLRITIFHWAWMTNIESSASSRNIRHPRPIQQKLVRNSVIFENSDVPLDQTAFAGKTIRIQRHFGKDNPLILRFLAILDIVFLILRLIQFQANERFLHRIIYTRKHAIPFAQIESISSYIHT